MSHIFAGGFYRFNPTLNPGNPGGLALPQQFIKRFLCKIMIQKEAAADIGEKCFDSDNRLAVCKTLPVKKDYHFLFI